MAATAAPPRRFAGRRLRYTVGVGPGRLIVALAACALAVPGGALADKEKVQLVAADQAIAKKSVVRLADLGDPTGWSGGATKPSPPSSLTCGSYTAKQSDLVLTGSAAAKWKHAGLEFDSEAQVLRTAAMVRLDWQRTVTHAGIPACLRERLASSLPKDQKLVSFDRLAFPKVASFTAAFRGVIDVTEPTGTVRVFVDIVAFGGGRVELTLITTAAYAARAPVVSAEGRLAQVLIARATPGSA
jgi:hypothetical protein